MHKFLGIIIVLAMVGLISAVAWSTWYDVQCAADSKCMMSLRKADYECTESHYQLAGKVFVNVCDNYRRVVR